MTSPAVLLTALTLLLLLGSCWNPNRGGHEGACFNGGSACAAADAPPGMRTVRKGYRITQTDWMEKTNRESGVPDIGIKAKWQPITERR